MQYANPTQRVIGPLAVLLMPADRKKKLSIVSFTISVLLFLFTIFPLHVVANSAVTPIMQWQFTWQDPATNGEDLKSWLQRDETDLWHDADRSRRLPKNDGNTPVWMRAQLPSLQLREAALFIPPVYLYLSVYIDGELIYTFDDPEQARGLPWHLIDLPEDFAGKQLALRISSDYTQLGLSGELKVGPRSLLIESMIQRDTDRVVIGLLLGVVGLLALAFLPRREETVAYIAFGAYALCLAAWIISHSYVKQLVVLNSSFWFYVWLTGLLGMFPFFMMYVERVFGPGYWQVVRRLRQFYILFIPVILTVYWLWGSSPLVHFGLNLVRVLVVVGIVITLIQLICFVRDGRRDAWLFLAGIAVLTLFTVHDVSLALGLIGEGRTLSHWGGLVLVLVMASVLGMRFNDMYHRLAHYSKQLESTARERELMVQDLHDGLGGMATNISMLADVARRQAEDPAVIKTLETISDLSRDSVSEIRGFMKSLDTSASDWPSFVADLRQYGTAILEPHGIDFSLVEQLSVEIEPPNSLLRLNIVRIYKEALTNIVKHAQAQTAEVQLKVAPHQFEMSIRDNGIGLGNRNEANKAGYAGGRGTGNIQARARDMGGEARIQSENGTHVAVVIPLPLKSPGMGMGQQRRS